MPRLFLVCIWIRVFGHLVGWRLLACLSGNFIFSGRDVMLPEEVVCYI